MLYASVSISAHLLITISGGVGGVVPDKKNSKLLSIPLSVSLVMLISDVSAVIGTDSKICVCAQLARGPPKLAYRQLCS